MLPDDESSDVGSVNLFILSKPASDFSTFFAVFVAVSPIDFTLLFASEAAAEAFSIPVAIPVVDFSAFLLPVIKSVNALNALASVANLPKSTLTALITGVNTLINP